MAHQLRKIEGVTRREKIRNEEHGMLFAVLQTETEFLQKDIQRLHLMVIHTAKETKEGHRRGGQIKISSKLTAKTWV